MMKTSLDLAGRVAERLRIAFAVLALALPWWLATAEALEIRVADVEIPRGATVSVPIRATDAEGLSALQMRLVFDAAAFEVVQVTAGPTLTNALIDFHAVEGACTIAFAATEPVARDGDVLVVEMRRRSGAEAGSTLAPQDVRAWAGEGGRTMAVSAKPGRIAEIGATAATPSCLDRRYLFGGMAALVVGLIAAAAGWLRRRGGSAAMPTTVRDRAEPPVSGSGPHFCVACGSPLPEGARFCPNCGTEILRPPTVERPHHPEESPPPRDGAPKGSAGG